MPRTAKQRAALARHKRTYTIANRSGLLLISAEAGFPKESWWTKPQTRQEFYQAVAKERPRMAESVFSRGTGLPSLGVR